MSRVAKNPVLLPQGVTATVAADAVTIKGAKGTISLPLRAGLAVTQDGQQLRVEPAERNRESLMHAGSLRAHLANVVQNLQVVRGEITPEHVKRMLGEVAAPNRAVAPEITARFFELPLREAREAFERIGQQVEGITARVQQIADSAGAISVVAEDASATTEEVSASTEQTSATTQEVAASAQELAATAEMLQQIVARFRLPVVS